MPEVSVGSLWVDGFRALFLDGRCACPRDSDRGLSWSWLSLEPVALEMEDLFRMWV